VLPVQQVRNRPRAVRSLLAPVALAVLGGLVYLNSLGNPFVYDDHRLILENDSLSSLANWRYLLLHDVTRPLVNVSHAIDYAIWGGANPVGFHLTNVLVHMTNIVLLFQLAYGFGRRSRAEGEIVVKPDDTQASPNELVVAVAAAILFAVHPALTQAVGYVSSRSDLLSATFLLTALLAARRAMTGNRWPWTAAAALAWACGLASKETAVMFPLVLLAYDRLALVDEPGHRKRLLVLHLPLMAVAAATAAARVGLLAVVEDPSATTLHSNLILVELDVFRRYLFLLFWPSGQTIFHAVPPVNSVIEPLALLAFAVAVAYGAAVWWARKLDRIAAFGLLWFVLLLIPSAVLVVLDRGEPMAEHRLYLASAGIFLVAGRGAGWLGRGLERVRPRALVLARLVGFLIIGWLAVRTEFRNLTWSRPIGLWLEAAEMAPGQWVPRMGLAEALHQAGRHSEAIASYRAVVALRPGELLAHSKLGQCLLENGQRDEAVTVFERLRHLDPNGIAASAGLGLAAMTAGDLPRAQRYLEEALARDPASIPLRQTLASIAEPSNPQQALGRCEEIKQLAPGTPGIDECIRRNRLRLGGTGAANR
jgi:tetratricopeptide (TPR) repeat protein